MTEQQREYLTRLQASSEHLLGLVNDVLDLSKLDAGRLTVTRETLRASDVVRAALALVAPQAAARGVAIDGPGSEDAGRTAWVRYVGDEYRVRQVLVNLLSNAVKFTPPGGRVRVTVDVARTAPSDARVRGDGPWTFVTVEDTGIGIAPEQRAAIFEPFVQVKSGKTREAGGTGLGLSISRRLAQLMGGDLTVESELTRGSAFTLWLPGAGAPLDPAPDDSAPAATEPAVQPSNPSHARVANVVREQAQVIIERYVDRVRHDPVTGPTSQLEPTVFENHVSILLVNLAQSLASATAASASRAALLHDGGEIQRVIAELHGHQRLRLGWTAAAVAREYAILREEIVALVRRSLAPAFDERDRSSPEHASVRSALALLERLLERASQTSQRALRHVGRSGDES